MQLGKWFDAYLEAEYRLFIERQQKAANRKAWYAHKKSDPPTLLSLERIMNELKPYLRGLSTLGIIASVGIAVYLWTGQAFTLPLGLLAIVLALAALWLQNESK